MTSVAGENSYLGQVMTSYYSYLSDVTTRQYLLIIVEKVAKANSSDKYTEQLSQKIQDVFHIHYRTSITHL